MNRIHIAVVDNGVDQTYIKKPLKYDFYIDQEGKCTDCSVDKNHTDFIHGTICAMIIEKYLTECTLSSIQYLDESGKGAVENLRQALEWCLAHDIHLVNLSLGSVHFRDKKKIRTVINHFANQGLFIVAATSNSGYVSYPASFSNIIGVAVDKGGKLDYQENIHLGLDAVASAQHRMDKAGEVINSQPSNSYAAPYITALIGKLYLQGEVQGLVSVREALRVHHENRVRFFGTCCEPDWISKAWIKASLSKTKALPYFEAAYALQPEALDQIDTIIIDDNITDDLAAMADVLSFNKHIVYLGKKEIEKVNTDKFFWSRKNRTEQIMCCTDDGNNMDIPVIVCVLSDGMDEIFLLTELYRCFYEDGYNIYTVSLREESVLYDLEFIPDTILVEHREHFERFIYYQTMFKQSDGVLLGISGEMIQSIGWQPESDIYAVFTAEQKGYMVTALCDEAPTEEMKFKTMDKGNIRKIYQMFCHLLRGENDDHEQ